MKRFLLFTLNAALLAVTAFAQAPRAYRGETEFIKAEDERRYDRTLESVLTGNFDEKTVVRALLAAGRIGDVQAVAAVSAKLSDGRPKVAEMSAFALGEIESVDAAGAILTTLQTLRTPDAVRARAVEAAGKIAAANPGDERSKSLGEAILDVLEAEERRGAKQSREVILLSLTAVLRAKPEDGDFVTAKFLTHLDSRIRASAANTLARLRSKNAGDALRGMLLTDSDPTARANAARALAVAAGDSESFNALLDAATEDDDPRVRVSAIRSLGALKNAAAADRLLSRGERLLADAKTSKLGRPSGQSEFIELSAALGIMLANTRNERAVNLFREYGKIDKGWSPEIYIARMRIAPGRGDDQKPELTNWRQYSTLAQLVGEFAVIEPTTDEAKKMKSEAPDIIRPLAVAFAAADPKTEAATILAAPDVLRAFAKFKTPDLANVLRTALKNEDIFIRSTSAELLAELPLSQESVDALKTAFDVSLVKDVEYNDAQLAILDALYKLDKKQSVGVFIGALDARDYLVRKKAFQLLADKELQQEFANVSVSIESARKQKKDQVLPYSGVNTKLGQILNTETEYRRAATRKNGTVKAVLTTEKGVFTIDLLPEDAPLTVDNFIKLARSNYFNGLEVHRVVPNFVMQDGDPRGDGNGGPGWSIRCEINMVSFDRGAVGMALSGKDTGGSQWFITHSPQPHLDGGYTVFGRVNEAGMKVVDNIVRGDKIISVKILESTSPQRRAVAGKTKARK